jgi:hypothetical protein
VVPQREFHVFRAPAAARLVGPRWRRWVHATAVPV